MKTVLNKYELIAQNHLHLSEIDQASLEPAFRRATPNMLLSTFVCQELLRKVAQVPTDQVSLLLGSLFGEVGASLDFLKTYHDTKVPRPILFQNSLHNSTVGFTTIQLGLTGPALTISTDHLTSQSAFDLVENMLDDTPFLILCFVDSIPESLYPQYLRHTPILEKYQNRAHGFLLCTAEAKAQYQLSSIPPAWDLFPCST